MKNSMIALVVAALLVTPTIGATLNPQPEPPGKSRVKNNSNKMGTSLQDNASGLPTGHKLPPGPCKGNAMASAHAVSCTNNRMLNPQPEPPG